MPYKIDHNPVTYMLYYPILHWRGLRHKEVKWLARGHPVGGKARILIYIYLTPKLKYLTNYYYYPPEAPRFNTSPIRKRGEQQ